MSKPPEFSPPFELPPINPFWMGPKYVPPMQLSTLRANWDQLGAYLREVLVPLLANHFAGLTAREEFTRLEAFQLARDFQQQWMDAFFTTAEGFDPDWPAEDESNPTT